MVDVQQAPAPSATRPSGRRPWLAPLPGRILMAVLVGLLAASFLLFLGIPLAALLLRESPQQLWSALTQPDTFMALQLSLVTTTASTLLSVLFGLPVAWVLARVPLPGRRLLETLVTMPTVLPPVVAGVALLLTFGRFGLLGRYLSALGISLPFTTVAVVMAQTFVSAPFFVNSARAGLEQLDPRYEQAAYTLRASPFYTFRRVVLPLIRPALLSGMGLTWARALGEFGATITFAGNFPGTTQTMPIAIYIAAETNLDAAVALSVLVLAVSFALLLALRLGREH
ncbi:ABC transporter permease [Thermogemmatispora sp.]|uniref:ABC transporter permease n=1 Tax=Thermogemmatispora sp. TaxID=1968838 RepID=UPI001D25BC2C|nr:ABC transporter permease [Thermogemmatispora sp.]MBX5452245.1 molybdate ABC transporter permease subunit [Thermogemmatispora sp.]